MRQQFVEAAVQLGRRSFENVAQIDLGDLAQTFGAAHPCQAE
jgi:hypothetical protein